MRRPSRQFCCNNNKKKGAFGSGDDSNTGTAGLSALNVEMNCFTHVIAALPCHQCVCV